MTVRAATRDDAGAVAALIAADQESFGLPSRVSANDVHGHWQRTDLENDTWLFESRGYREVRRFWEMAIELDGPPPEPTLPDGLTVEIFREEEARRFHAALDEAFQDHWEHHSLSFEEWWETKQNAPDYDPTTWF